VYDLNALCESLATAAYVNNKAKEADSMGKVVAIQNSISGKFDVRHHSCLPPPHYTVWLVLIRDGLDGWSHTARPRRSTTKIDTGR